MTTRLEGSENDTAAGQTAAEVLRSAAADMLHAGQPSIANKPEPAHGVLADSIEHDSHKHLETPGAREHLDTPPLPSLRDSPALSQGRKVYEVGSLSTLNLPQPNVDTSFLSKVTFYNSRTNKTVPDQNISPLPEQVRDQPQERPPNGEARDYTVKTGDNLWKIAREHLEPGASNREVANYVRQIEADNPMPNPNLIMPGQVIKMRGYAAPPTEHGTAHGAEHHNAPEHHGTPEHYRSMPEHHRSQSHEGLRQYTYPSHKEHEHESKPHLPPPDTVHNRDNTSPPDKQPHNLTDAPPLRDQPLKPSDAPQQPNQVAEELQRLNTLAQQKVHNQRALADIETNARELAATEGEKARLYMIKDKLSYSAARDNARTEIIETYKQAQRLLLADKPTRLSRDQLHIVAAEILHHAANPDHIDQGLHNTCQTTALESMMYKLHPSKAAKLVADVALTGKFTSPYDGTTVEVDPKPQDEEAKWYPTKNGERSLASQIFQDTAINLAWDKKDPTGKTHYEQVRTDPNTNTTIEELVQQPSSPVHIPSKYENTPYLFASDVAAMRSLITGKPEAAIVVEGGPSCDPETVCISSPHNLAQTLQQRKEAGKLPIILYVDTSVDGPFKTTKGGIHAILATDITGGPNPEVRYYNWWGQASTDRKIGLDTLYKTMRGQQK